MAVFKLHSIGGKIFKQNFNMFHQTTVPSFTEDCHCRKYDKKKSTLYFFLKASGLSVTFCKQTSLMALSLLSFGLIRSYKSGSLIIGQWSRVTKIFRMNWIEELSLTYLFSCSPQFFSLKLRCVHRCVRTTSRDIIMYHDRNFRGKQPVFFRYRPTFAKFIMDYWQVGIHENCITICKFNLLHQFCFCNTINLCCPKSMANQK